MDLPKVTYTQSEKLMFAAMDLLESIAFAEEAESRIALARARESDWRDNPQLGMGDKAVRGDRVLAPLADLFDRAETWLSLADLVPLQQRAAERLIRCGAMVTQTTAQGVVQVCMAADVTFEWQHRGQLCNPEWLLRLFMRDPVAADGPAAATSQFAETAWTRARPPAEWGIIFDCSWKTLTRRIHDHEIVARRVTSKAWRIRLEDTPVGYDDSVVRYHKTA